MFKKVLFYINKNEKKKEKKRNNNNIKILYKNEIKNKYNNKNNK